MARAVIICLLMSSVVRWSAADAASLEDRTLPYGCSDTVVVGRLKNTGFKIIQDNDDIIGHGIATADLDVRKTVKGHKLAGVIPVKYVAHAYMREGREFMLVLRKKPDGSLEIEAGQLMSVHPLLASRCD